MTDRKVLAADANLAVRRILHRLCRPSLTVPPPIYACPTGRSQSGHIGSATLVSPLTVPPLTQSGLFPSFFPSFLFFSSAFFLFCFLAPVSFVSLASST